MCGIAGALDLRGERVFPEATLRAMLRAIAHRGPDGSGIFAAPGIAMAAQRLAMLDIEDLKHSAVYGNRSHHSPPMDASLEYA